MTTAIRVDPDPILYQPCKAVPDEMFGGDFLALLVRRLRAAMDELAERPPAGFEGMRPLGLAAPQIGVPLRVFITALYPQPFINPRLEYVLDRPVFDDESCYSLPGVTRQVGRARLIRLRYRLLSGEERSCKMRDRDARVAQHENDHLDGITIHQRAEPDWK